MKYFAVLAVGAALTLGQPALAATAVQVLETPTAEVRDNPACQEVTYTYPIGISSDEVLALKDAAFKVLDAEDTAVMTVEHADAFPLTGDAFATQSALVNSPCAAEQRYGIYSDDFKIEPGETEDFQIRVFFTPEQAGSYRTVLTGLVFLSGDDAQNDEVTDDDHRVIVAGGGVCANCRKEDAKVVGGLGDKITAALAQFQTSDNELADITAFIKLLIELGIIK